MSGRFPASQIIGGTRGHISAAIIQMLVGKAGWQNCPAGQSQEVLQGVAMVIGPVSQYPPPSEALLQRQPPMEPPGQESELSGSQPIAFGGIQEATQVPLLHLPLQH